MTKIEDLIANEQRLKDLTKRVVFVAYKIVPKELQQDSTSGYFRQNKGFIGIGSTVAAAKAACNMTVTFYMANMYYEPEEYQQKLKNIEPTISIASIDDVGFAFPRSDQ